MENFDTKWIDMLEYRFSNLIAPLDQPILLSNSYSLQEYQLTHKFISSSNAFLGNDLEGNRHHIKVVHCKSYDHLKENFQWIQNLQKSKEAWKIVEVQDLFEVYDEDSWLLIIVSEFIECLSLEELSQIMKIENIYNYLPKEASIYLYLYLLDIIKASQDQNVCLKSIFPDSVLVIRELPTKSRSVIYTSSYSYSVKITVTTKHSLECGKSKLDKIYPDEKINKTLAGELWGLGLCLYSLAGTKDLAELPVLRELENNEKYENLEIRFEDPALESLLFSSFNGIDNAPFDNKIIQIWKGLWLSDWNLLNDCTFKDLDGLHSGLLFESPHARFWSLKKFLLISDNDDYSADVSSYLNNHELLPIFLQRCIKYDWKESSQLINSVFKILQYKAGEFNEYLIEIGLLVILDIAMNLSLENREILYDFIMKFMYSNSLTPLQIVWESGLNGFALGQARKNMRADLGFIKSTMSFFGPNSIEFIADCQQIADIPEFSVIQALVEVPYYFKLEKEDSLLEILAQAIVNGIKNQPDSTYEILKASIFILEELLCLPMTLQYYQLIGQCNTHSNNEFIALLGKHPMLVYCIDCSQALCVSCSNSPKHFEHKKNYLLYQSPHSRCNCEETHDFAANDISQFKLPTYSNGIQFHDSDGNFYEEKKENIFYTDSELTIMTAKPLIVRNELEIGTVSYFEIKVQKAGKYENICIGFEELDVFYYGKNGNVTLKGELVMKGPRYGSWDTVGIGMTHQNKIYITYNGLIIPEFIDVQPVHLISAKIVITSGAQVMFKVRNWMFKPDENISPSRLYSDQLVNKSKNVLEIITNQVRKACKGNSKDKLSIGLRERLLKLLDSLNLIDLKQKALKKGKKFWPF